MNPRATCEARSEVVAADCTAQCAAFSDGSGGAGGSGGTGTGLGGTGGAGATTGGTQTGGTGGDLGRVGTSCTDDGQLGDCLSQSSIEVCTDGQWTDMTCTDVCEFLGQGYTGDACGPSCACEGYLDQNCADGVNALCGCNEFLGGVPCTSSEAFSYYVACYQGNAPEAECAGRLTFNGQVVCGDVANCLN